MGWFYLGGACHETREGEALPKGAVPVDAPPKPGEVWNGKAFVFDARIAADLAMPAGAIDQAHAIKAIEATLWLSGFDLKCGLIFEEAASLAIDPRNLAQTIADHGAEFRAREVARRTMKTGANPSI